jgi:hypothetical protein
MGGGLMQLVAYGAQDVYLTGNPQITFFKVVYRRHTNFAVECIEQTFNGTADFGRTVTCNIARNGDLITKMYLKIDLENTVAGKTAYSFVPNLGFSVIDSCKVEIGGSKIDEQYGDWLNIWEELAGNTNHTRGLDRMIGNVADLRRYTVSKEKYSMYVPMKFWFCRNNGLALPLIALQYHDVRVTFVFNDAADMISTDGTSRTDVRFKDATLLIDYVYLDSEERKRFAQASHEYLIEQLQYTGEESVNTQNDRFRLNFNHPCKALYWALKLGKYTSGEKVVCLDNEGQVNRDYYAKVIWLASRQGLCEGGVENANSGGEDVVKSEAALSVLGREVKAHLVYANNESENDKAPLTLDNVVIIENNITAQQMSKYDVNTLLNDQKLDDKDGYIRACLMLFARTMKAQNKYSLYVDGSQNPVMSGKLQLNGHDRFATRSGNYFNYVQPYEHWSNTPSDGVNCYSFALNPEEHQPSGSCNMSRIDNATLLLNFGDPNAKNSSNFALEWLSDNSVIQIYTINYNVLRIMSGMGGLAYSN